MSVPAVSASMRPAYRVVLACAVLSLFVIAPADAAVGCGASDPSVAAPAAQYGSPSCSFSIGPGEERGRIGGVGSWTVTVHRLPDRMPSSTIDERVPGARTGEALAAADFDGDGIDDLVVGSPGFQGGLGQVAVYSGASNNMLFMRMGTAMGDALGTSVAAADVNGDGRPDVVAGSPGWHTGAGLVTAWSVTGAQLWSAFGRAPGDALGFALAASDRDLDPTMPLGRVVTCSPGYSLNQGAAVVLHGSTGATLAIQPGPNAGAGMATKTWCFGVRVADASGDGLADIIVASPLASNARGVIRVTTARSAVPPLWETAGSAPGDNLGASIAVLGWDPKQKPAPSLVAGCAPGAASGTGSVVLYSGASGSVIRSIPPAGGTTSWCTGIALADVDRDGAADIIVARMDTRARAGLVMDRSSGGEVWNQPVYSYDTRLRLVTVNRSTDGTSDIAVGGPDADPGGAQDAGGVSVFTSRTIIVQSPPDGSPTAQDFSFEPYDRVGVEAHDGGSIISGVAAGGGC